MDDKAMVDNIELILNQFNKSGGFQTIEAAAKAHETLLYLKRLLWEYRELQKKVGSCPIADCQLHGDPNK